MTSAFVIAAPSSGSGKTTVTLALLRLLKRRGIAVSSCKVGPDYIDPSYHAAASGRDCLNLDGWAMRPDTLDDAFAQACRGADVVIVEGVMGLFDGARVPAQASNAGSTADLAAQYGWPVVLVMDVAGQAASAAATLEGFVRHRNDVNVAGVIFNKTGGPAHARLLAEAVAGCLPELIVVGALPRDERFARAERHLGLVQAREHADLDSFLDRAAEGLARHLDVDALLAIAQPAAPRRSQPSTPLPPLGQRIAVASDIAFGFLYPLTIEGWRRAGAELRFFSPLADEPPPSDADAVFLPGGYPELHAARLAANDRFLSGLRSAAGNGAAIVGECGGYMVLGRSLVDGDGARHAMAGLLPVDTSFAAPRLHLGYRRLRLAASGPLGQAGATFRGHEFHYASVTRLDDEEPLFEAWDASGVRIEPMGLARGRVAGSFAHLIDQSCP